MVGFIIRELASHDRDLTIALIERAATATQTWTDGLCQLATAVLPNTMGSAISTYDQFGTAHPAAACDDRSLELEQLQQVAGEGPGHDAHAAGRPVVVDNVAAQDRRWPGYAGLLNDRPVGTIWSFPVLVGEMIVASLTIYHEPAAASEQLSWSDALELSELAATAMVIDADLADGNPAAQPPDVVDLASGVLAIRAGVGVDSALALVRGHAFSTGRRISEVARDVLSGLDLG